MKLTPEAEAMRECLAVKERADELRERVADLDWKPAFQRAQRSYDEAEEHFGDGYWRGAERAYERAARGWASLE